MRADEGVSLRASGLLMVTEILWNFEGGTHYRGQLAMGRRVTILLPSFDDAILLLLATSLATQIRHPNF